MRYKPLAGWIIWAYKPSQAVIGLVMACKELPRVETPRPQQQLHKFFSDNFLDLSSLCLFKPLFPQIFGDLSLSSGAQPKLVFI
jgi:hypothetical protein